MTTLIRNAIIVTNDAQSTIHHDAAIAIEANRIAAIGPTQTLDAQFPNAEPIEANGRAIFPGFANTHTHLVMTLARGVFEDLSPPHTPPFCGGLSPIPLPTLTAAEQAVMCQLGALEALRSGTTAILEEGSHIENYAQQMLDTGLRMVLAERSWDRAGTSIGDPAPFIRDPSIGEACIARTEQLHAKWHGAGQGRIHVAVSAWAPDMCSPQLLQQLHALQQRLDTIATIHLNQIWGEVAAIQAHHNLLPTQYLDSLGVLHRRLVAAHCRCMDPLEEQILGTHQVNVAFNSAIAARRGLSPRIEALEQAGCTIAMGTDNMAEDMIEVMRTGLFMERIRRQDGRAPAPEQALNWATANGYQAMGIPKGGILAPGHLADLIMVRTSTPHLTPFLRPVSVLVHQAHPSDVADVMVDGAWLMRDSKVLTMDEPGIIAAANEIATRTWLRLFAENPTIPIPKGFQPL